jgi:hypothetical protein
VWKVDYKPMSRYLAAIGIMNGAPTLRSKVCMLSRYSSSEGPSYHGAMSFGTRSLIPRVVWALIGMKARSEDGLLEGCRRWKAKTKYLSSGCIRHLHVCVSIRNSEKSGFAYPSRKVRVSLCTP